MQTYSVFFFMKAVHCEGPQQGSSIPTSRPKMPVSNSRPWLGNPLLSFGGLSMVKQNKQSWDKGHQSPDETRTEHMTSGVRLRYYFDTTYRDLSSRSRQTS